MSLFIVAAFSVLRLVEEVQRYAADFRQRKSDTAMAAPSVLPSPAAPCDGCAV
jgi:hypothetical protein